MEKQGRGHVLDMLERERGRLARDIHDGPAQYLTNTAMRLDVVRRLLEGNRLEDAARELERLQGILRVSINDVRRMIFDLRPTYLERGVHDAIVMYSAQFQNTYDLPVKVTGDWSTVAIGRTEEVALFRVFQELLNNVQKHAEASEISVTLGNESGMLRMSVQDNGRGFNRNESPTLSFGLQGIRERLSLIHGHLEILSTPGQGTCVCCEVPVRNE
jgi:signal transduction histidine kinase